MKFKIVVLAFLCVLLCGCSTTKTPLGVDETKEVLKSAKFEITDTTEQVGYADTAFYAIKGFASANYVKGKKKYDIQGVFLDECKNIYGKAGSSYEKDTSGGKNWTYLKVTNDEKYYFVGWIENTYIVIEAPKDQTEIMDNLTKKLGF